MSFDTNWDINKYNNETEPKQHWELRKKFILANQQKFPEDKLVALAKAYTNIEFLGCSYPKKTMELISELSYEISDSYRKNKKSQIQRTFVSASDAAKSRASGKRDAHTTFANLQYSKDDADNKNSDEEEQNSPQKKFKPDFISGLEKEDKLLNASNVLKNVKNQDGWKGKLVYITQLNETPWVSLHASLNTAGLKFQVVMKDDLNESGQRLFVLQIEGKEEATVHADNIKQAKNILAENFVKTLQKFCFTIKRIKSPYETEMKLNIEKDEIKDPKSKDKNDQKLTDEKNNIGLKLMKMMGWSGKGLGKEEDGREDIIEAYEQNQITRIGFGNQNVSSQEIMKKLKQTVLDYAKTDMLNHLIFSADFTKEERAFIHNLAQKNHLQSRSYGKNENRRLVLSRKLTTWDIVNDLIKVGGKSDEFQLISPTNYSNE